MKQATRELCYLLLAASMVLTAEYRTYKSGERLKSYRSLADQSLAVATNTQATCEKLLFQNELLKEYILKKESSDTKL